MDIIYFHQYFGTPQGSSGTRSYELARALLAAGHRVTMVCASDARTKTGLSGPFKGGKRSGMVEGIEVIEFQVTTSNYDPVWKRVVKFVHFAFGSMGMALTRRYDLAFATSTPLSAALPGLVAKVLRGKPFVFEVRDLWPEMPRAMGMRNPVLLTGMEILEWLAYRAADRCIALSPGMADGIARRSRPELPIDMIPNGCDLELFDAAAPERIPGTRDGDLVGIYAGTHGRANGLNAVLDAAAELKKRERGDIKFVLIGDGSEKPQLTQRAAAEGLDNVMFLDLIPKTLLAQYLRGADIGLQIFADVPEIYNGTSPNKFFDYVSAGLPVLINYPGWLANLVRDEAFGFVTPPGDAVAFADALERAAADRQALRAMGAAARRSAERHFSRADLAARFVAALGSAAANRAQIAGGSQPRPTT